MEALRLFVAISVPPEILIILTDIQNRLKKLRLDAKWTKPENIHLTLKFLGTTSQVFQTKRALAKVFSSNFVLTLSGIKVFPNLNKPRILAVDVQTPCDPLTQLHKKIEEKLLPLGFAPDTRPFNPHLTLARIKSGKNKKLLAQPFNSMDHIASFKVKSVQLYQSQLTREGATYTVLETFVLTSGPRS